MISDILRMKKLALVFLNLLQCTQLNNYNGYFETFN